MNFLFHMQLSGDDDQILVGNFMGDFVKGNLDGRFPERTGELTYFCWDASSIHLPTG